MLLNSFNHLSLLSIVLVKQYTVSDDNRPHFSSKARGSKHEMTTKLHKNRDYSFWYFSIPSGLMRHAASNSGKLQEQIQIINIMTYLSRKIVILDILRWTFFNQLISEISETPMFYLIDIFNFAFLKICWSYRNWNWRNL